MHDSKWDTLPLCRDLWMHKENPSDPLGLFEERNRDKQESN